MKTLCRSVALVLLFMVTVSTGRAGDREFDDKIKKSVEYMRQYKYTSALSYAEGALGDADGKHQEGRALFLVGYIQYLTGDYSSARKHLKKASVMVPELAYHALRYGAESYQKENKYEQAVKLWEKLERANPPGDLTGVALIEMLRCQRRGDEPGKALKIIARISSHPDRDSSWNREIQYTEGWAKALTGAKADARSKLISLWRDHPENFWAEQAVSFLESEDGRKLLLPGEESHFTDGDRIQRIKNLIDAYHPAEAMDELRPFIEKAEKGSPPERLVGLYKLAADASMKRRRYTTALDYLGKAQALQKTEDLQVTYDIADCHRRSGRHVQAINIYKKIWTDHPRCAYATRSLFYAARLLKLANDWDGAEAAYRKLASDYTHSSLRPESLFQIAWIRYLKGDNEKAKLYFDRVPRLRDSEFNARTLYWKSRALHAMGETKEATEVEDTILEHYWKSNYSFYLVTMHGRDWPYRPESKVIPREQKSAPVEYRVAKELLTLGLFEDAEGQLNSLDRKGRMDEWLVWSVSQMYLELDEYYLSQRMTWNLGHRLATPPPGEKKAWRLSYPRAYPELVTSYAEEYDIDPFLVWSLMRAESTYRPTIRSSAGAVGLMQIMPGTGRQISRELRERGFSTDWLKRPEVNVRYGCYYLKGRLNEFAVDEGGVEGWMKMVTRSLAAYNAGPHRSREWAERTDALGLPATAFVEEIPIKETREYVKRILKFYLVYLTTWPREEKVDTAQYVRKLTYRPPFETTAIE